MDKRRKPSSKKQRQLIAIACSKLGIDKHDKQGLLLERFNKASTVELTYAEAEELIDDMVQKGFFIPSKKRPFYRRRKPVDVSKDKKSGCKFIILASPAERAKISALADLVEWKIEGGLERWMSMRFGFNKAKTADEAFKVIEGLKGLIKNQLQKRYGKQWRLHDFSDNPGITAFIKAHC